MTTLLVASIGGHLTQIHRLRPRLATGHVVFVTNDSPQSRSLLAGEDVEWVPYVAPRDAVTAAKLLVPAWRLMGRYDVESVISTGSAVAVPFLTAAALRRHPAFYIESATRADGPSQTFQILRAVPGVQMRTQSPEWATPRHPYVGSVFDGWTAVDADVNEIRRIVVSLGTMKRYSFRALVDRVVKIMPPDFEVLWQVGVTDVSDLPIDARPAVPADELQEAIRSADAIIAHAGTGIALTAMEAGRCPVLVPRRASRHEHVDDHQLQTARRLADAGLAVAAEVDDLSWDDVIRAAARRVVDRPDSALLDLGRGR